MWYVPRAMEQVVLSWLVLALTDSPFMVSLVGFSRMLPMFLFGLVSGGLADRFDKKRVMIASQAMTLATYFIVAILLLMDVLEPWHAITAVFITGSGFAFDFAARRSFFSEILDQDKVANAVSLDTAVLTGSQLVGPLMGGFLVDAVDFQGTYIAMLLAMTSALVLLSRVASPSIGSEQPTRPGIKTQFYEALREVVSFV